MALPAKTRDRLQKLLGMTGSAHDGEALNALRLATTLMQQNGMTWAEVLAGAPAAARRPTAADAAAIRRDAYERGVQMGRLNLQQACEESYRLGYTNGEKIGSKRGEQLGYDRGVKEGLEHARQMQAQAPVQAVPAGARRQSSPEWAPFQNWREMAEYAQVHLPNKDKFEQSFLPNVLNFSTISDKQRRSLHAILAKMDELGLLAEPV